MSSLNVLDEVEVQVLGDGKYTHSCPLCLSLSLIYIKSNNVYIYIVLCIFISCYT